LASYGAIASTFAGASGGWYLDSSAGNANHDSVAFGVGSSGATAVEATTPAGTLALNAWTHVVGRFDNTTNTSRVFLSGVPSGSTAAPSDFGTQPSAFALSSDFPGYGWNGQLDECFVATTPLTDTEICRICSCGIDGTLCACLGTAYASSGRNAAECNGCTLPPCDANPPVTPTPTPTPTATPVPGPDWGGAFAAVWDLDEQSDGSAPVTRAAIAGTCSSGGDCDLTDDNTTPSDAVNKQQGARAASFTRSNAESLSCTSPACSEIRPAAGASVTTGCWARHNAGTYGAITVAYGSGTGGWYLDSHFGDPNHDSVAFGVGADSGSTLEVATANLTMPNDTWRHVVGRFDDTAGQSDIFLNGESATTGAATGFGTQPSTFSLSSSSAGFGWDGQLDECFVATFALTDQEICRICSCGIDGTRCACFASTYVSTGRNTTECGNCTLPAACDAPPPSAPTPTPTPTPTDTPTP